MKKLIVILSLCMIFPVVYVQAQQQQYKIISLRSYFEKYLNVNFSRSNEIHATYNTPVEKNAQFRVVDLGDGRVAFKASNDKYLSNNDGKINASSIAIGDNEKFKTITVSEDWIAIQCTDGTYWSIEPKKDNLVITGKKTIREWETFNITVIFNPTVQAVEVVINGIVTDSKTNSPLGAEIELMNMASGEVIATVNSDATTGKYTAKVPSGVKVAFSVKKERYMPASANITTDANNKNLTQDFVLTGVAKGERIVLNNILFQTGKSTLKAESYTELDKLYSFIQSNPSMVVEISGYTDNIGSELMNMKLSQDRANSVRDYLLTKGVNPAKIVTKGYGMSNPIATNATEAGRQKNRRVEFKIMEN